MVDNFVDVSKTAEFLELREERLLKLLKRDDLDLHHEGDVTRAVIRWLKHAPEVSNEATGSILDCIRLPLLSVPDLLKLSSSCAGLMDSNPSFKLKLLEALW